LPDCQHGQRDDQENATVNSRRQPSHQRRADAQHNGAVSHEQTSVVNADPEARRKLGEHARRAKNGHSDHDVAKHQHNAGKIFLHVDFARCRRV
jgi:hypothetical protein